MFLLLSTLLGIVCSLVPNNDDKFYIAHPSCSPINKCPFDKDYDKIKFYSNGLNYTILKDNTNKCDIKFFECVKYYFTCPYILTNQNQSIPDNVSVFIGSGINLSTSTKELFMEMGIKRSIIKALSNFFGLMGKEAYETVTNKKLSLTEEEIDTMNEKYIEYFKNKLGNISTHSDYLNQTGVITPLVSIYMSNPDDATEILSLIRSSSYLEYPFFIEYFEEGTPHERIIESLSVSYQHTASNPYYKIGFIADTNHSLNVWGNVKNFLLEYIKSTQYEFSLLTFNDTYEYVFNFTNNYELIKESLEQTSPGGAGFNIQAAISNMKKLFEEEDFNVKRGIYYKETLVLVTTVKIEDDKEKEKQDLVKIINELKESQIDIIIICLKEVYSFYKDILKTDYNIIPIDSFQIFESKTPIFNGVFNSTISRQAITIKSSEFGSVQNVTIKDIDSPEYFRVVGKKNMKYKIEFQIEQPQNASFQCFASNENPYPTINDYQVKHLGLWIDVKNPQIVIDTNDEGLIFFAVYSYGKIKFNVKTMICQEGEKECQRSSNGLFGSGKIQAQVGKPQYYTFSDCFKRLSNFDEQQIAKFYSKGFENIERDEDYEITLYSLAYRAIYNTFNCLYFSDDEHKNLKIGHLNKNLPNLTALELKRKYSFPRLLINKLRPFLYKKYVINASSAKNVLEKENVEFNEEEMLIITKAKTKETETIINRNIEICHRCTRNYAALEPTERFILLSSSVQIQLESDLLEKMTESKYEEFFNSLPKEKPKTNFFTNMQHIILRSLMTVSTEKGLMSVVMGKSFFFSSSFTKFKENFLNEMCVNGMKVSFTIINNGKYYKLFDFNKNKITIDSYITNYNKKYSNSTTGRDDETIDLDYVLENEKKYFRHYDNGLKKIILIIGDENLVEDERLINHKISYNNGTTIKKTLKENQLNLLLMTTLMPQMNYHEFKERYSEVFDLENIFPVESFKYLNYKVPLFGKLVHQLTVRIPQKYQIITDIYEKKLLYYEIMLDDKKAKEQTIFINSENVTVYYSPYYPYPDHILNSGICEKNCTIKIDSYNKLYVSFVSPINIQKLVINFSHCTNGVCSPTNNLNSKKILTCIALGLGLLIYAIYFCRKERDEKKKTNIFK